MTANAMQGDREKYLEAGMTDYVSKPFDQRELLSIIARRANVSMPEIDAEGINAPLATEVASEAVHEDTAENINDLLGDLDDLLDGTGR